MWNIFCKKRGIFYLKIKDLLLPFLSASVADPDPRSGMGKIKIRIRDEHHGSYFRELWNHVLVKKLPKFLNADADPESGIFLTQDPDPGWIKFGSGILDKHPGSVTLLPTAVMYQTYKK
jgi:hypothetical protein